VVIKGRREILLIMLKWKNIRMPEILISILHLEVNAYKISSSAKTGVI